MDKVVKFTEVILYHKTGVKYILVLKLSDKKKYLYIFYWVGDKSNIALNHIFAFFKASSLQHIPIAIR